ncbi:MAG TPA: universal stress protein [Acidimicrobiales bacterium]|nr:universal stress protein [Acidimicrobiales bacterium]
MAGEKRIVVGVDGSEVSMRALEWAVGQCRLTGARLRAVTAWQLPVVYGYPVPFPEGYDPAAEAERALAAAVGTALGSSPDIEVDRVVGEGPAAQLLIEQSKDADLLVVGSRGHGAFAGMLLGSVSEHCVRHATCPVLVVRDEGP